MPLDRMLSCFYRCIILVLAIGAVNATAPFALAFDADRLPELPARIPSDWLRPDNHPRVVATPAQVEAARQTVKGTPWGRSFLEEQKEQVAPVMDMSEQALRDLIPPAGSVIVHGGYGNNLDPVYGRRMRWAGWDDPHAMLNREGTRYPNNEWKDTGEGVRDPKTGEHFYFRGQAYGQVLSRLDNDILPALANVYALTEDEEYARTAAVLFDAIASYYPTNRRGPLDYPISPRDEDRGGRMQRPYYQVARALMNLVPALDLIAASSVLETQSAYGEFTIREHVIRNVLWDGGTYCLGYARSGQQLHNGHADYLRGAAVVGVILGERIFAEPMVEGPRSIWAMLAINIDRNGFYYEVSPSYATHTRTLYLTIADLAEAMRRQGWQVPSVYTDPVMYLFLKEPFNRSEVGGIVPQLGDAAVIRHVHPPMRRLPHDHEHQMNVYLAEQIRSAWIQLVIAEDAARRETAVQLLADSYADADPSMIAPPSEQWYIYHVTAQDVQDVKDATPAPKRFETVSQVYGAKGLALLRGGEGDDRYGTQLAFGPSYNHGQREALTWTFYSHGTEWSFDPGYQNAHFRMGWTSSSVAHQMMTVNEQSVGYGSGMGHLLAWHDGALVQWAMAEHPGAYEAEEVEQYQRLIAQVHNPKTGKLGYWLDVSRVRGGNIRDDSFHTQMLKVELPANASLEEMSQPSLYGDEDFGRMIRGDLRLEGYGNRGFYWTPPGDGYGFLGSPRRMEMAEDLQVRLEQPIFATRLDVQMIVDLAGSSGRELIVADAPDFGYYRPVPYLIRRDKAANQGSVFAKTLRLIDPAEEDHLIGMESVALTTNETSLARAYVVNWQDGTRDVWLIGDGDGSRLDVDVASLPRVSSDAVVTFVRFDNDGRASMIRASAGTAIEIQDGPQISGEGQLLGEVTQADPDVQPAELRINWTQKQAIPKSGAVLVTHPSGGQAATWRIAEASGNAVTLMDTKLSMGETVFEASGAGPGWYRMHSQISRFRAAGGRMLPNYAVGKAVYAGHRQVGRIVELGEDGEVRLERPNGAPVQRPVRFTGQILEVGQGDSVVVPTNMSWNR